MSQLNITQDLFPPGSNFYLYTIVDVPGVVAANNYRSVFNPANSIRTVAWISVYIHRYTIGASQTPNSMCIYRTTAASGGTLVSAANIEKSITTAPNSVVEVRTGNPTVSLRTPTPVFNASPPISTGAGNASQSEAVTPQGSFAISLPGEGFVWNTGAGNTNQMWGLEVVWAEF